VVNERIIATYLNFENPLLINDLTKIQTNYEKLGASKNIRSITRNNQKLHFRMAEATENYFFIKQALHIYQLASRLSLLFFKTERISSKGLLSKISQVNKTHRQIINLIKEENRTDLLSLSNDHASLFKTELSMIISRRYDFQINFPESPLDSIGLKKNTPQSEAL